MILNKIILIISSIVIATNAQCPTWWWPMSNAYSGVNFFSEVMRGQNIVTTLGVAADALNTFSTSDRLASRNYKSIALGAKQFIVLPADTYFCNGAFTISFFLFDAAVAAATIADFLDVATTNIVRLEIVDATSLKLTIGSVGSTSNAITTIPTAWTFLAVSYGGSVGTTPNFFSAPVSAPATTPSAISGQTAITTGPSCSVMTQGTIGAKIDGTSPMDVSRFNDFKIYNFALSTQQVQNRFTAEVGKLLEYILKLRIFKIKIWFCNLGTRVFTCSSSSINPQYFYIVLVAVLACFY